MRPLRSLAAAVAATSLALAAAPALATAPPVTAADVEPHLAALADIAAQNGGNRAAGNPGADRTAEYLAARLTEAGWQVRTQAVGFPYAAEPTPPVLGTAVPGRDFTSVRLSGAGDATGRVRTILTERCRARSFRSVRRGEIALLPFSRCTPNQAARFVKARGGVGIVYDGGPETFPLKAALTAPAALPVVVARTTVALRLSRSKAPVRLKVDQRFERRTANNVIAELPGSSRIVMAGGHLDSVPEGAGINDNGSGLAALLELAERLPAEKRRKTVRLGFWTAEEYGLFGSKAYVRSLPAAERRRMDAYINLDMVGSPNPEVEVYDSDDALERAMRSAIAGDEGETPIYEDSDHAPFAQAGIPVNGVYTGSLERTKGRPRDRCYHRSCDGLANADRETIARIATGATRALTALAG